MARARERSRTERNASARKRGADIFQSLLYTGIFMSSLTGGLAVYDVYTVREHKTQASRTATLASEAVRDLSKQHYAFADVSNKHLIVAGSLPSQYVEDEDASDRIVIPYGGTFQLLPAQADRTTFNVRVSFPEASRKSRMMCDFLTTGARPVEIPDPDAVPEPVVVAAKAPMGRMAFSMMAVAEEPMMMTMSSKGNNGNGNGGGSTPTSDPGGSPSDGRNENACKNNNGNNGNGNGNNGHSNGNGNKVCGVNGDNDGGSGSTPTTPTNPTPTNPTQPEKLGTGETGEGQEPADPGVGGELPDNETGGETTNPDAGEGTDPADPEIGGETPEDGTDPADPEIGGELPDGEGGETPIDPETGGETPGEGTDPDLSGELPEEEEAPTRTVFRSDLMNGPVGLNYEILSANCGETAPEMSFLVKYHN